MISALSHLSLLSVISALSHLSLLSDLSSLSLVSIVCDLNSHLSLFCVLQCKNSGQNLSDMYAVGVGDAVHGWLSLSALLE